MGSLAEPPIDLACAPTFNPNGIDDVDVVDIQTFCIICQLQFDTEEELKKHLQLNKIHAVNVLKAWFTINKEECDKDKFGISVVPIDVKVLEDGAIPIPCRVKEGKQIKVQVQNNGESIVLIRNADFLRDMHVATIHDDLGLNISDKESGLGVTKDEPYKRYAQLEPNTKYTFTITCQSFDVGMYYIPLAFDFHLMGCGISFSIIKTLAIQFSSKETDMIENASTFTRRLKRRNLGDFDETVPGMPLQKEPDLLKLDKVLNLDEYRPRNDLRVLCQLREWDPQNQNAIKHLTLQQLHLLNHLLEMFEEGLVPKNYSEYFSTLLHIEEIQMEFDIRAYDIEEAKLEKDVKENFYKLKVPGLLENRPSLLRGDQVFVQRICADGQVERTRYQGIVHHVESTTVTLGFDERFSQIYIKNLKFHTTFTFSRLQLKRMHHALENVTDSHMALLFPRKENLPGYSKLAQFSNFTPFNQNVALNEEQRQVILQILNGTSQPAPYLLFGPPGTGKTMTLAEAVKQIWHFDDHSHVLICAPSNSACDTVTERLLDHIPRNHLFRMYASSRDKRKISEKIIKCCNYNSTENEFYFPSVEELQKYRILVMTLASAGRLVLAAFPKIHFTHIFIDEAGQSIEPESLIPIIGLLELAKSGGSTGGNLILAGDPLQLGPVLRSKITAGRVPFVKDSLATSLLERLMSKFELYERGENGFDRRYITKLVHNYRSHEAILRLPNTMFYDGELIPCADKLVVNSLCDWENLPRKGFPLIFHGVMGRDKREHQSPSYYNPEEVCIVANYVRDLLKTKKNKIQPKDIGIISPYRKQVEKIRLVLDNNKMSGITVGSTEEFQGQERRVIIISTVRSNTNVMSLDVDLKLGFLKNAKRFNVAITRAKALLIIVGNPYLLIRDYHWGELLKYCLEHQAYRGCRFTGREDAAEDMYERFERLNCIPDGLDLSENIEPISQVELDENPPWPLVTE